MLVLSGNQVTPIMDTNLLAGEPQSNLWFGKTDDLWHFGGKPAGWGGPWWKEPIAADAPSDPYLMTGFDRKVLHISHDGGKPVDFLVEIDFHGTQDWVPYTTLTTGRGGYGFHTFPEGFSAHWVRITASASSTVPPSSSIRRIVVEPGKGPSHGQTVIRAGAKNPRAKHSPPQADR